MQVVKHQISKIRLIFCLGLFILVVGCQGDHRSSVSPQEAESAVPEADGVDGSEGDEPGRSTELVQPNIIVILTDDLDVRSTDAMLEAGFLPNIKKVFVDSGINFTESFVTTSLCCPSRSTYLTGLYTHNHGVLTNMAMSEGGVSALDDSETIAVWLQRAGYVTAHLGKYLNGYGVETETTYIPPGWDEWYGLVDWWTYKMYGYKINENGKVKKYGNSSSDYQTDVLAQIAADLIRKYEGTDAPLFLSVNPLAVHLEISLQAFSGCSTNMGPQLSVRPSSRYEGTLRSTRLERLPSFNEEDVTDKPYWIKEISQMTDEEIDCVDQIVQDRLESLRSVDDMVGTIVEALEETGRLENTVLFFTSDNGYLLGEHRLSQYKSYAYEESIRVPLYLRIPGISESEEIHQIVLNNDLAPTIADLAGATPGVVCDGRSLLPLLDDPERSDWRKRFLIEFHGSDNTLPPAFYAIRTGPTDPYAPRRLYVVYEEGREPIQIYNLNNLPQQIEFAYESELAGLVKEYEELKAWSIDREEVPVELYDLEKDPYQLESVHRSEDYSAEREYLDQRLLELKTCGGGSCQTFED